MSTYQKNKEKIRQQAIDWQNDFSSQSWYWSEIAEKQDYFERNAKRYGLVKEFKENGII